MTRRERRAMATLAAAILLPLVLFAALQAAFSMQGERRQIENDALGRAREVNAAVDGALLADESALQVLTSSQLIVAHDWAGAQKRIAVVLSSRPRWRDVILTDARNGREIFETGRPLGAPRPARPWIAAYLAQQSGAPAISGVVGARPACPCIAVHEPVFENGRVRYVLTAELRPDDFQAMMMARYVPDGVTAIVDRQGVFIARSMAYPTKLGKPATRFVRDAIAHGKRGLYRGVTYEGLKNFTAFETSALTGWSTHVAVKASLLSGPSLGSLLLTLVAAAAALLLAAVIAAFAWRQVLVRRRERNASAQSQKLAAVGQLASGIAHDFNNLLMVISTNLQRLSDKAADPALRKSIDNAKAASDRCVTLIQQLMAFTRSQPLDIGRVDLAALLRNMRELLQQSIGAGVALTLDVREEARHITSNASQLELAILNLAVNARDAMPDGGALILRARPSKGRPTFVDLEVVDTGQGMPKDVLDRALEPFFTTKPEGKGTGLGLAQVFGIVSQSGGAVDIESRPGHGTTITLRLPRDRS